MKKDVTILVNSCDSYEDCWMPFFRLLEVYWPDCPCDIVLNSETKSYSQSLFNIIHFSDINAQGMKYGERMLENLKRIKTPYVLLLLDDFFIRCSVDSKKIEEILHWMKANNNIAVFSFANVEDELNIPSKKYPGFDLRPSCGDYKLNLQAALWNRKKLIKYIRKHESPWDFETIGNRRAFGSKDEFYVYSNERHSPIYYGKKPGLTWGIVRGKWYIEDVKPLFEKHGIIVDYSIRGAYEPCENNQNRINKKSFKKLWLNLKSSGILYYIRFYLWRVYRKIMLCFGFPMPNNYITYLRDKQNLIDKR